MREKYEQVDIVYAESLNRLITQGYFSNLEDFSSVLFVSSQPFYEYYYDKFSKLFSSSLEFQWYICPNNIKARGIDTFQSILEYMEEMTTPENTLIIGAGGAELFHLCGALKKSSPYLSAFYYLPSTLSGFIDSLFGEVWLNNSKAIPSMKQKLLPDRVVYDTMLMELETREVWRESFFKLIHLAVTQNAELLKKIYQVSLSENYENFSPFIASIIQVIKKENQFSSSFGKSFTKAFYRLEEAHYLNISQKEYIGFLLHLLWTLERSEVQFDYNKFYFWFESIVGIELKLPEQMLITDLTESLLIELTRYQKILCLKEIGQVDMVNIPDQEELFKVIEMYRRIK
ncbi:hypothetical protein [Vagococcus hydrophili]|uniref:3-dehydroquinate synthase domain-containing protein n=1 Tax=Vagococcus hydrophili TaxID=2714947 RepID=A0A6G8AW64_9ENTE|nr:hypothetical protein [Vagococcus hydrophili]QIL49308.1 hypothetical protein G7082_12805 [Vagococcus hydrophili]